jgi:hypothetical protein
MKKVLPLLAIFFLLQAEPSFADENVLTSKEKSDGWILLFDGKSTEGWLDSKENPAGQEHLQDGCLNPHPCSYMLIRKEVYDNFKLSLEFKISKGCNSGIFVRTFPLQPRPGKVVGFNGIEIAIDDTITAGFHDTGAIYDLVKPAKNAMKPQGEWNRMIVTCVGAQIQVDLNDEEMTRLNLDEWTEPHRRPDGSEHKFDVAYKEHPRQGYIGLQDHGSDIWFRNIKLLPLK